ncbi:MAG: hypothetical protein GXP53_12825 [Deltaproteobacteria bacterium]|nr:hypothetical protein [Deltaproteobacteria bacterium]
MQILNFLTPDILYDLARGPFVWASFVVFIAGCLIRTIRILSLTKKWEPTWNIPKPDKKDLSKIKKCPLARIKLSVFGTSPVTMVISVVFHLLIFVIPLFLLGHNILLQEETGISLFSFSQGATNVLTLIFLFCALFFFLRRILLARMRAISTCYDYIIFFIAIAPFLTGILAFYQPFNNYQTMIILHMLSGELMLIAIPFTKIFHMVFFFMGRFMLVGQHTLGRGTRTW